MWGAEPVNTSLTFARLGEAKDDKSKNEVKRARPESHDAYGYKEVAERFQWCKGGGRQLLVVTFQGKPGHASHRLSGARAACKAVERGLAAAAFRRSGSRGPLARYSLEEALAPARPELQNVWPYGES